MPLSTFIPRTALRDEALRMLHGEGKILKVARDVSQLLRETGIEGAVIGGVAVVLHGHVRTTDDVDVYVPQPAKKRGFAFDAEHREFKKHGVPVHLVLLDQIKVPPAKLVDIDDIRTVSLADLIAMKLRSGSKSVLRSQDLADVIGLIRRHRLTGTFAAKLDKPLRPEFRKLVKAIGKESK